MTISTPLIDYDSPETPELVRRLKPEAFEDGEDYCVVLGDNIVIGVTGCGSTIEDAMDEWVKAYLYLIKKDPELKSIKVRTRDNKRYWTDYKSKD